METTKVSITEIADLLSVIPLILSFEPTDGDLVVLGLNGETRLLCTARFDLADFDRIPDTIWVNLEEAGVTTSILIGYGPRHIVAPAMEYLLIRLSVRDAIRVEGDRYFCMMGDDCPSEGRLFTGSSAASTKLRVEAGLTAEDSREALVATMAFQGNTAPVESVPDVYTGRKLVEYALSGAVLSDAEIQRVSAALTMIPVRDHAWGLATKDHVSVWREVTRRTPDQRVPAPASLLAFTAWQNGNGALANVALDRALTANPDYTMAQLLSSALSVGLPASAAVLPMSPEDIAQSYGLPLT